MKNLVLIPVLLLAMFPSCCTLRTVKEEKKLQNSFMQKGDLVFKEGKSLKIVNYAFIKKSDYEITFILFNEGQDQFKNDLFLIKKGIEINDTLKRVILSYNNSYCCKIGKKDYYFINFFIDEFEYKNLSIDKETLRILENVKKMAVISN